MLQATSQQSCAVDAHRQSAVVNSDRGGLIGARTGDEGSR